MVCGSWGQHAPQLPTYSCVWRVRGKSPLTRRQLGCLGLKMGMKEAERGEDDLTIVFPVKNHAYRCPQIRNRYLGP